jgi:hypothetical protein
MAPDFGATSPAPAVAPGLTTSVEPAADTGKRIHVGLHTGVVFPQLQSERGTTIGGEIEFGYRAWRNLSPYLSVAYAQPTVDADLSDPRLPGDYQTSTTQRELTITVGALWRFFPMGQRLNAYAGVGARTWLLKTITNGESDGEDFLENTETSTRFGAALLGGVEYILGPGAAVFELDLGGSDLPHLITGDVSTTAIATTVGYRLLF